MGCAATWSLSKQYKQIKLKKAMKTFTGESANGNIQEALDAAIEKAKTELTADHVQWKLESVEGRDGGFILERFLAVTIRAKVA